MKFGIVLLINKIWFLLILEHVWKCNYLMIKVFTLIAFVNVFWGVREFKWIDLKPVLVDTIYFIQRFNNNKFLLSFISCNTYVIMYYIRVWSLMIMQIDCTSFTVIHSVYKLSCTKIMYLRIRARSMFSKFYRNQDSPWTSLKDTFTWLCALE